MVTNGACISLGSLIICRDSDCLTQGHLFELFFAAVLLLSVSACSLFLVFFFLCGAVFCADLSLGLGRATVSHLSLDLVSPLLYKCILNLKSVPRLSSCKPSSTMATLQL